MLASLLLLCGLIVSPPVPFLRNARRPSVVMVEDADVYSYGPPPSPPAAASNAPAAAADNQAQSGEAEAEEDDWQVYEPVRLVTKNPDSVELDDFLDEPVNRILVIYTGGTLGMTQQPDGSLGPSVAAQMTSTAGSAA